MEVTPPEKLRPFLDVGAGGESESEGEEGEGRVRTSQHFRVRSSPPVRFRMCMVRIVHQHGVYRKRRVGGCKRMEHARTTVRDISIPIVPRGDPRFVFVRVPAGGQCVARLSRLDEDNLPIREGDYERIVGPTRVRGELGSVGR